MRFRLRAIHQRRRSGLRVHRGALAGRLLHFVRDELDAAHFDIDNRL
jgi:hypothetical protein